MLLQLVILMASRLNFSFFHLKTMKYFQLSYKTGENVEIEMNHCFNEMIEINKDGFEEQIRQRMKNETFYLFQKKMSLVEIKPKSMT
jgi:hypothetical protein